MRLLSASINTVGILKAVFLTALVALAVIPLAACLEIGDVGCGHACCTGADRSRPLQRALRRARALLKSAVTMSLSALTDAIGLVTALAANLSLAPSPNQAVPLRI